MANNFRTIMARFNIDAGLPPIEKEIPFTSMSDLERAFLLAEKKYQIGGDSLEVPPEEKEEHDAE